MRANADLTYLPTLSENGQVASDCDANQSVGLWRSWERASMAWKRSSVRSRPGPPTDSEGLSSLLSPLLFAFIARCFTRYQMQPNGRQVLLLRLTMFGGQRMGVHLHRNAELLVTEHLHGQRGIDLSG